MPCLAISLFNKREQTGLFFARSEALGCVEQRDAGLQWSVWGQWDAVSEGLQTGAASGGEGWGREKRGRFLAGIAGFQLWGAFALTPGSGQDTRAPRSDLGHHSGLVGASNVLGPCRGGRPSPGGSDSSWVLPSAGCGAVSVQTDGSGGHILGALGAGRVCLLELPCPSRARSRQPRSHGSRCRYSRSCWDWGLSPGVGARISN